ncbi:hypothetical protein [Flavonifractor sp. An306]|uniref:hypothetical protein n=1 Tax=Flavonifractor sp. An306 TaxID=1965629 RepID=UPI001FA854E8|nr:hypothetical protein [Flavonifractor sp. An306]
MNSESGQRLPMEELKQRNAPQTCPNREEWDNLLMMISALYRVTAEQGKALENLERHTALLRETCPGQAQLEALAEDAAQIRAMLQQAGERKERSVSPPSLSTALSVLVWLALILLGTMVGMVVLRALWSGLAALWSAVKMLIP